MVKLTQNSWLGGQMDERMSGRQDMKNYRNGASVLKNFVPVKLGSIRKRPGTDLVCDITSYVGTGKFRMIPFGFLSGEGFVLVLCAGKARAYKADGSFVDVTGSVPYSAGELDQIGYVQCGDVLFLAHQKHHPKKIEHDLSGTTHSFAISDVDFGAIGTRPSIGTISVSRRQFEDFYFEPSVQSKLDSLSAKADFTDPSDRWAALYNSVYNNNRIYDPETTVMYAASVVIDGSESSIVKKSTSYREPWTQSQVITIPVSVTRPAKAKTVELRLYKENGGAYGLIGSHILEGGETRFTFRDDNIAPDTSETPMDDSDGVPFSEDDDYPGSVGLYQQRLVWAGTKNDPARIWMSRAGDFYEYRPHDKLQLDDAIDFILPITQFANINFIIELGRLFAFSECTELVIGSASDSAGVSYETIMATEHSHLGCTKRLPPIVANNTLLFVNRTGQSVRDYDERIESSRFGGTDVSVFATSIFADNPIVDWTWQQEPNSTVWCVLKDGRLASFTYDKEQEIAAWAIHELGGGGKAVGIAKTCAVFGREAGRPTTGEVMVAVERSGRITLERMRPWGAANGAAEDLLCMDCMCDSSKSVAGMTCVNIDGTCYFGYTFESVMTTMPPVIGDNVGQAQFDVKLGQHAHLRLINSAGGEIFAVGMRSQASLIDDGAVRDGEDGAEFRDVDVVLAGSNNRDGRVTVRHRSPSPFQLALLELDYEAEN